MRVISHNKNNTSATREAQGWLAHNCKFQCQWFVATESASRDPETFLFITNAFLVEENGQGSKVLPKWETRANRLKVF